MDNKDFYAAECLDRSFTRNGQTKTYRARELTGAEAENLFDLNGKNGERDPAKAKGLDSRLIATAVSEVGADGGESPISVDLCNRMPAKFRKELATMVMEVNAVDKASAESAAQD